MKTYLRFAAFFLAIVIAVTGVWYWITAERAEARKDELRNFMRGAIATAIPDDKSIQLRAVDLPGKPIAFCTVRAYDGIDTLQTFLGPQRYKDFLHSYHMDDNKGGIIVVHDKHIVVIETSPLAFSTVRTACSDASNLALVISRRNGRRLDLQPLQ